MSSLFRTGDIGAPSHIPKHDLVHKIMILYRKNEVLEKTLILFIKGTINICISCKS